MMGSVTVQTETTHGETAKIREQINTALTALDDSYSSIMTQLDDLDGAANAQLIDAMEKNKDKAHIAAGVLLKLLIFIENSATQVKTTDAHTARSIGKLYVE